MFYPAKAEELERSVDSFLAKAKKQGDAKAIIVPHAGYMYSGQVAASGFREIRKTIRKVFIIAANHNPNALFEGASVPPYTHYTTPLGEVLVSALADELRGKDPFVSVPEAHMSHVVEVELPFLQRMLKEFEIIPMITSNADAEKIAAAIKEYIDDDSLIIVSADQSHYHPYGKAVKIDKQNIKCILDFNMDFPDCEIDGEDAVSVLLLLAKELGWSPQLLEYKNSGDVTGDKSAVVGYASIGFYQS